jgi:hypothetical protein
MEKDTPSEGQDRSILNDFKEISALCTECTRFELQKVGPLILTAEYSFLDYELPQTWQSWS